MKPFKIPQQWYWEWGMPIHHHHWAKKCNKNCTVQENVFMPQYYLPGGSTLHIAMYLYFMWQGTMTRMSWFSVLFSLCLLGTRLLPMHLWSSLFTALETCRVCLPVADGCRMVVLCRYSRRHYWSFTELFFATISAVYVSCLPSDVCNKSSTQNPVSTSAIWGEMLQFNFSDRIACVMISVR